MAVHVHWRWLKVYAVVPSVAATNNTNFQDGKAHATATDLQLWIHSICLSYPFVISLLLRQMQLLLHNEKDLQAQMDALNLAFIMLLWIKMAATLLNTFTSEGYVIQNVNCHYFEWIICVRSFVGWNASWIFIRLMCSFKGNLSIGIKMAWCWMWSSTMMAQCWRGMFLYMNEVKHCLRWNSNKINKSKNCLRFAGTSSW